MHSTKPITSQQLPSPKGFPILGHLPQFNADDKHKVMEAWVKEVGDVFRISLLGKKFIISADTDINKEVLRQRPHHFRRFHKIDEILSELGINGVFNAEDDTWRNQRKVTSEALNMNNVRSFFPTISSVSDRLLKRWIKFANEKAHIDVQKEMMRYTIDITTEIAFGHKMNTLEQEDDIIQNHLEKIFPMINYRITAPIPFWRIKKSKKDKVLDEALEQLRLTIHSLIAEAKKRLKDHPNYDKPANFLEALLIQQETAGTFSDEEVFGNVFTMLLAGEDTTSNTISWTLYYLSQYPEIVSKIRTEANDVLGDKIRALNVDDIGKLKFSEAVAMESMRLKPVSPSLYMQALKDVEIKGYHFKKGETIMMQNKVAQTKEKNFIRPDEFMPERWISNGCPVHGGAHKPELMRAFGGGSRFCPGKNLSLHEQVMAVSTICKNFDLSLAVKPEDVKEIYAFTVMPKNLLIQLEKA